MKVYSYKVKVINLSSPERISHLLIEGIKSQFPIKSEAALREIIDFIDGKVWIEFDVDILEENLMRATEDKNNHNLIYAYFYSLRYYYSNNKKSRPSRIKILTGKRKVNKPKPHKYLVDKIREKQDDQVNMEERWKTFEEEISRLNNRIGIWEKTISFSETEEDPAHRK